MARPPYVAIHVSSTAPGRKPRAEDIVLAVQKEVLSGSAPVGMRLPPVRVLEQQLGISKNTAQAAYDELTARGLVASREREGMFVAQTKRAAQGAFSTETAPRTPPMPRLRPPSFEGAAPPPSAMWLSAVFIEPALLPREKLSDCARSVLATPGMAAHYDAQGLPALRECIARRLIARGMPDVTAENVVITSGSQQALDLVARTLEVRRVAVESPVYAKARQLFESAGLAVTGLAFDPFRGVPLEAWQSELARAAPGLLYAITSFQNPTGYSYTTSELEAVLGLAQRFGFGLLEDDWGSDMLSHGEYRPTLRALGGSSVLYVNSFTKKLLPSLRTGFLVADRALVPALVAQKRLSTLGTAWLPEALLAEFLDRGYYDTHLATLQAALDARYTACVEALRELMPPEVRFTTPGGGPTLWLELPSEVERDALAQRLLGKGIAIEDSRAAFHGLPHLSGFRIGYAFHPPERLRAALRVVAEEITRGMDDGRMRRRSEPTGASARMG